MSCSAPQKAAKAESRFLDVSRFLSLLSGALLSHCVSMLPLRNVGLCVVGGSTVTFVLCNMLKVKRQSRVVRARGRNKEKRKEERVNNFLILLLFLFSSLFLPFCIMISFSSFPHYMYTFCLRNSYVTRNEGRSHSVWDR